MNINYHYYTVKTLAVHAGFSPRDAQYIAYYSQYIDDFIMHSPFILDREPPAFFIENGLAKKLRAHKPRWAFSPCATGINAVRTLSSGYRLTALMPFHFIMTQPYNSLHKNAERSLYRCVTANRGGNLLVNRLVEQASRSHLMNLGMILHTLADSYAHEGFSGFQGWENASYVNEGMTNTESAFYRALPSIGHANAGSVPDDCGLFIDIFAKKTEKGSFESFIRRDNTAYFADCSRRILDILCAVNKKDPFGDREWYALQTKLAEAQSGEREHNIQNAWENTFPHISYSYKKDEFINIRLDIQRHDEGLLQKLKIKADDLHNSYSEEGDRGRLSSITLAQSADDEFFRFNEAAYCHVRAVTGEYSTRGHRTQLEAYCDMAEGVVI
ncbi:MAG: hypothetical protein FWD90_12430 [Defluviitaleaceae bacterium]|nr:hypothetical protein [Defluviitaleaceae bacterium]